MTSKFQISKAVSDTMDMDFSQVFQNTSMATYMCDAEGKLTFFNKAAVQIWGRTPQLEKESWCGSWKIFYPDGNPMPLEKHPMVRVLQKGTPLEESEVRIQCPDGSFKFLLVFPQPIFGSNGKLKGAYNSLIDITDQKEDHIKKEMLSAIVDSSDDAIVSKNLDGIITSWNRGAQEIFGYSEAEVLGKSITLLIPEDRLKEEVEILRKIRDGIKIDHFETIRKHKSGRLLHISITVSPVKDSRGKIIGASKVARDITTRIEAQAALEKHIKNLETLNYVGKNISENLDAREILKRVTDATTLLTGAKFGAFVPLNDDNRWNSLRVSILSGTSIADKEGVSISPRPEIFKSVFTEKKLVRIDNFHEYSGNGKNSFFETRTGDDLSTLSFLAVPVILKSGKVIGGIFFGHPQAGTFSAEHELLVANIAAQAAVALENSRLFEQVKSLSDKKDEFIGLVSHELKTPLTTIKGYLQVLSKKEVDKMAQLFLTKSLYQVNKLNTLVDDLLNMSRIESGQLNFNLEVFDLKQLVEDVVETFSYSSHSHRVVTQLSKDMAFIKGDKQRIEQAILNIMTNAIKYSPDAEEVYIDIEVVGENVILKVRDQGIGLTPEQMDQLFTRFYRADNTQGISGLGLGLYLTKQIIDRHAGKINVSSEFGKGSEFSFTLPLETGVQNKSKTSLRVPKNKT